MKLINRLTSETPTFFKNIRNICGTLAVIAGGLYTLSGQLGLDPATQQAIVTAAAVLAGIAGTSQLTTKSER